jgi:hypothetical protein
MGLKGYRLWVMGRLDSNVQSPTTSPSPSPSPLPINTQTGEVLVYGQR